MHAQTRLLPSSTQLDMKAQLHMEKEIAKHFNKLLAYRMTTAMTSPPIA
tara:strand:- start:641 stop:787 length:147 start_codon:yes stop_codon:yes gene_type:complete